MSNGDVPRIGYFVLIYSLIIFNFVEKSELGSELIAVERWD